VLSEIIISLNFVPSTISEIIILLMADGSTLSEIIVSLRVFISLRVVTKLTKKEQNVFNVVHD